MLRSESESHFLPARLADVRPARRLGAPRPELLCARSGASTTRACRRSWPRPASSSSGSAGTTTATRRGRLAAARGEGPTTRTSSSTTSRRTSSGAPSTSCSPSGHGPLSFPPALAKASRIPRSATGSCRPTRRRQYDPNGRYIVIGAGIASVNEWANILDLGAKCISLTPHPEPDEQDLNTPRCFFEALGIDAFQALSFEERIQFLGHILKGTTPQRRSWLAADRARPARDGRFEQLLGEIDQVGRGRWGSASTSSSRHGADPGWLDVTGRRRRHRLQQVRALRAAAAPADRVLRVPIEGGRIKLQSNCGVPGLDRPDSRCG